MSNHPSSQDHMSGDIQFLQELGILSKEQTLEPTDTKAMSEPEISEGLPNVYVRSAPSIQESFENASTAYYISPLQTEVLEPLAGSEVPKESNLSEVVIEQSYQENVPLEVLPEPPEVVLKDLPGSLCEDIGEPTFESLGLGGWTPVGIIQNCLESLHVMCDLPWWGSIVIGTVVVRILMFPLVIISQRNAAKMNNNLPEMQLLQLKLSEARERGDRLDSARYAQEMIQFMREKGLNPLKNMLVPFAQAPLFISFFMGLRKMANLPVDSLRDGGIYWFVDLTVPDQFYLLPLITCATLALTIEVGTDTARLNSSNVGILKYVLRAVPLVVFPFSINFPAAILVYWTSANFISLIQVATLRIPRVREYFKIEKIVKHDKTELLMKNKGFVKGVKDSWTNLKITRELEDRHRVDQINFMRAGRGAIKKTYKFDPTQPTLPKNMVQAKKRND